MVTHAAAWHPLVFEEPLCASHASRPRTTQDSTSVVLASTVSHVDDHLRPTTYVMGDVTDHRRTARQSKTRNVFGALFIMTSSPSGKPGSGALVTSMPSVASAGVRTSKTGGP